MEKYENISEIAKKLKNIKKKVILIYAFNATGKTRLSVEFKDLVKSNDKKTIVYYNAFTEDLFYWDNDLDNTGYKKLMINKNSSFIDLIKIYGKENEISKKFKEFTLSKIEPNIDISTGEITFVLPTGDSYIQNIKISKGEESIFIFTVFFVLLETIVSELSNKDYKMRSTDEFNNIKYIFIDDPISSLDDNCAIDTALRLKEIIKKSQEIDLKFIISTHHSLFYNVLHTELKNAKKIWFSKTDNKYIFKEIETTTPFGYHLLLKNEIKKAIENKSIKRYHFNLLRNLFEKTAHFLGYDSWKDIINEDNKEAYIKRINLYSHSNHSVLEAKELEPHEKEFFRRIFEKFIKEYKWKG